MGQCTSPASLVFGKLQKLYSALKVFFAGQSLEDKAPTS